MPMTALRGGARHALCHLSTLQLREGETWPAAPALRPGSWSSPGKPSYVPIPPPALLPPAAGAPVPGAPGPVLCCRGGQRHRLPALPQHHLQVRPACGSEPGPASCPNGQGWCGSLHRGEILMNLVLFLRRSRVGASSFPGSSACPPWALP